MKNRKHSNTHHTVSLATFAVAAGTLAAYQPAPAQQDDATPASQPRFERNPDSVAPPAEFDEEAKGILAKSLERYKSLKSWHVESEVVNAGRFTKRVSADFRAPQTLVVTTNEAKGIKTVAHYNAGTLTTIRNFDNLVEYQVSSAPNEGEPRAANAEPTDRAAFANALGQYLSGFFLAQQNPFGRQTVQSVKYAGATTVKGVAVDTIAVRAVRRGQPVTITYSIGKQDSLVHRVVQTAPDPGPSDNGPRGDYVETYSHQKVDAPLPDSAFKLILPTGAKKVNRFTPSRGIQVAIGGTPFAITANDLNGKPLSLNQYKGKVVLLDFWATWCAPCRAELPNVKAAYAKYKDQGFDIVGISFDISTAPVKPFLSKEAISWRQVYDGYWNGPIARAYNVRFVPSTILIGRDGKVAAVGVDGETLGSAIEAELLKP